VQELDLGSCSRGEKDGLESVIISYNKTCPYEYEEERRKKEERRKIGEGVGKIWRALSKELRRNLPNQSCPVYTSFIMQ
jgi:hypothetical protein